MVKIKRDVKIVESAEKMVELLKAPYGTDVKQLHYCNAYYYDTYVADECYCVLVSYATIVAYYHYGSKRFIDILRPIYGYTATSAKHISKFKKMFDIDRDIRYM